MRAELIELLRCPELHDPTPLVTVAHARDGDRLMEGVLGCPVCNAEFLLRGGVVDLRFSATRTVTVANDKNADASDADLDNGADHANQANHAMKLAALLGLADDVHTPVVLCGAHSGSAHAIESMTDARCVGVVAQLSVHDHAVDMIVLPPSDRLPFADQSMQGIAIDGAFVAALNDATRIVRVGGRVVAPAGAPIPLGCRELARDATMWVAEVVNQPTTPINIRSRATTI